MNRRSEILSQFKHESGSKVWPSDDPEDSPFDKYTCHLCGEVFELEAYGTLMQGEKPFDERTLEVLRDHILITHILYNINEGRVQ